MSETPPRALPKFATSPSFPFDGQLRVKHLEALAPEPNRLLLDHSTCVSCQASDDAYVWVSERWRVRASGVPGGLPMVLVLETRSHLDLGDLPNMLAAELGVMTVRVERAIRSLDTVAHVHVVRHGEDSAHLQFEFSGRPVGRRQLAGPFLPLWNDILEPIADDRWHEDLAAVAAWLGEFGGRAIAEPPRIVWHAPSTFGEAGTRSAEAFAEPVDEAATAAAAKAAAEAMAAPIVESADAVEPAASTVEPAATRAAAPTPEAGADPATAPTTPATATEGTATEGTATGGTATQGPATERTHGRHAEGRVTEAATTRPTATEATGVHAATTQAAGSSSAQVTGSEPPTAPAQIAAQDPGGPAAAKEDGGEAHDDAGRAVGRASVEGDASASPARGFVALPRQTNPNESITYLDDADLDMSQLH